MSIEEVYDVSCSIGISISLEERVIHLLSDISPVFSEILLESEHEKSIHHDQFGKTEKEKKEYKKDLENRLIIYFLDWIPASAGMTGLGECFFTFSLHKVV